jgi:murein DD-endopeptidase MepM/ murein hydrolase activator NlpD
MAGTYEIFGEPLYAPCAGEVIIATDGVDEMTPPEMDPGHMAGNHVILKCGGAWVLLGHLQKGSVEARTGQRLAEGQRIGLVGNTGNTGEPHLHIHAQLPGTENAPSSGEPLPIRFDRRYPVRNARIKTPAQNATRIESGARDGAVVSGPSTEEGP